MSWLPGRSGKSIQFLCVGHANISQCSLSRPKKTTTCNHTGIVWLCSSNLFFTHFIFSTSNKDYKRNFWTLSSVLNRKIEFPHVYTMCIGIYYVPSLCLRCANILCCQSICSCPDESLQYLGYVILYNNIITDAHDRLVETDLFTLQSDEIIIYLMFIHFQWSQDAWFIIVII